MRVLVIGGSGYVAGLVLPRLAQEHTLRIFDKRPPKDTSTDFVQGDVCDFAAIAKAAEGMDTLLYMAMGQHLSIGLPYQDNVECVTSSLDANVKGVYIALQAAHSVGIPHAVYTSSMSIYDERELLNRYFPNEEVPPDGHDLYGFTKQLGEAICRNTAAERGMSINILRLCWPTPNDRWLAEARTGIPTLATAADDLADALHAAFLHRGNGCEAFMISGDYEQKKMSLAKAKRLLGWEPRFRPVLSP